MYYDQPLLCRSNEIKGLYVAMLVKSLLANNITVLSTSLLQIMSDYISIIILILPKYLYLYTTNSIS